MMDKKEIGINQRIPLHVLESGLVAFLHDEYSSDYVAEQLRLDFEGENRIWKISVRVDKIIPNSLLASFLQENKIAVLNALKAVQDRNLLLMSLVNTAYPFCFKMTQIFGKYFKVQDAVNTDLIRTEISKEYGSNRSTHNAFYAVIPMLLEAGFFERPQAGIYKPMAPQQAQHRITCEIYEKAFRAQVKSSYSLADLLYLEPYFGFITC